MVDAHSQKETHRYIVHYPEHEPRESDVHYKDFEAFKRKTKATAQCAMGLQRGDFSECDLEHPLETHHAHVEFALANEVSLEWLERDYPGVSNPDEVGAWVESADNLVWYCRACHRGPGGVHNASASDWEAEKYIRSMISKRED